MNFQTLGTTAGKWGWPRADTVFLGTGLRGAVLVTGLFAYG